MNFSTPNSWINLFEEIFRCTFSPRSFQANFGCSPDVCSIIWNRLTTKVDGKKMLCLLTFLKTYGTYDDLCLKLGVCEKTFRTYVWELMEIFSLELVNVDISARKEHAFETFFENRHLVIDTTACRIQRPQGPEQALYYSGKHKYHCLKYEVGVRIFDGKICWVTGGHPGSNHDLTIYHQSGLLWELDYDEQVLGDKGYQGGFKIISPYKGQLSKEQEDFNRLFSRERIIVERVFGLLKTFTCLDKTWRHSRELHPKVFAVCVYLTNIKLDLYPL